MSDRAALVDEFLAPTIWRSWQRTRIAGDASARQYLRLTGQDQSVILMDAPPALGETTKGFVGIAHLLGAQGLCAPNILAHDAKNGLIVLSDLGRADYAKWLQTAPADAPKLYRATADVVVALHRIDAPDGFRRMTPDVGAQMIDIVGQYYSKSDTSDLTAQMRDALDAHAACADTFALRDFHAENLIWRPERSGTGRVGLLDFQDAFIAPAGYDLMSLLRDARRDVDPDLADEIIAYVADRIGAGPQFRTQLACLSVQRNLRIMGVFKRLAQDFGKTRYLAFMPRVWGHILRDLDDPALARLRQAVRDCVPPPIPESLSS